jgi:hypothetical protein
MASASEPKQASNDIGKIVATVDNYGRKKKPIFEMHETVLNKRLQSTNQIHCCKGQVKTSRMVKIVCHGQQKMRSGTLYKHEKNRHFLLNMLLGR